MKYANRILPIVLASMLAATSVMGSGSALAVFAADEQTEATEVLSPAITFDSPYASVDSELHVTVSNAENYTVIWYVDGVEAATGESYLVTAEDLEKFIRADVVADGTVLATNSIYCSRLPVVYIECENLDQMNGSWTHEDYYDASMKIQGNDEYNKEKQLYDGAIEIKGRGSSTWGFPKKPYKIKLDSKTSLFGMGKNKHWVLLANYSDKSLIRNDTAYSMAEGLGELSMDSVFVDVVINGEYCGNYQLCEHVRIDENRVDIFDYESAAEDAADAVCAGMGITDKKVKKELEAAMSEDLSWMTTGTYTFNGETYSVSELYPDWDVLQENITNVEGYLLELATNAGDDITNWKTPNGNAIAVSKPEFLLTNSDMLESVQNTIGNFENALYSSNYNVTIDGESVPYNALCNMDSLYGYWTTCMIFMNEIGHRSNYLYLKDGEVTFGPVWDYDWSAGCYIAGWPELKYDQWWGQGAWAGTWFYEVGMNDYFAIKEQEFYWNNRELIDSYLDANDPDSLVNETYAKLYESGLADSALWHNGENAYTEDFESMTTWLANRLEWMDTQFATEESAVQSLDGTVSSNLTVTAQNADGSLLAADDISVIPGGGKVQTGADIQITAKVNNSWEASYMAVYVNNTYVDTVATEGTTATFTIPAAYLNSETGTKNVIQVYGMSSPNSTYYSCKNFVTVVQYEGDPSVTEPPVTTTTTEAVTTTTTTVTTTESETIVTTTTTTPEPETTTTTTTTTTPEPQTTTTTTTTTTPEPETTTTTTTTTTPEPETTTTTTTTTPEPETTTTTTTTTTPEPETTTTTTTTTTAPAESGDTNSVVLSDVPYGTAFDLSDYDYKNITAISLQFRDVLSNAGGNLVLGGWSEQHPIHADDLTDGAITFEISNPQSAMTIYNYYGLGTLESVTLHYGNTVVTTATSAGPTLPAETTTTTAATTVTSAGPTLPAETTTQTHTETTVTTVTTTSTTTTTTTTTKPTASEEDVILTDVTFGTAYTLTDYDYKNLKSITLNFNSPVNGSSGCLVLGGWSESHSIVYADLDANGSVTFEISKPQDVLTIYNYYGLGTLNSVTLHF